MKLSDFDFELPERLIATRPAVPRTSAKMLVAQGDHMTDTTVANMSDWLRPGDRLGLNDTRVIPARLSGLRHRDSAQGPVQARIEVTLLEPRGDADWTALIKPLKKLKIDETVVFSADLSARLVGVEDGQGRLRFNCSGEDFDAALNDAGAMPLPPYIAGKRPADAQDMTDYQTVFAKNAGAVAAPTASLHFDQPLLDQLAEMGVRFSHVTLHVGAGTFLPVKVDDIADRKMHSEWGQVSGQAAAEISGNIQPWEGDTDIFITPGFEFNVADALMTNFHLPKSTLMMLVSALMGQKTIQKIYNHAIESNYRFFSYGDASLLFPKTQINA